MNPDNFTHKTNEALVAAHEMASEASSIAAAGPAPFSTCDSFVCSQFKSSSGFGFVSDLSSDFAPHLAFRLILFLGDLEGIRWEQVMRTRQGHQNPLLGMID